MCLNPVQTRDGAGAGRLELRQVHGREKGEPSAGLNLGRQNAGETRIPAAPDMAVGKSCEGLSVRVGRCVSPREKCDL